MITVKRLKFTNCNCILKLFFKGSENAVYQLKVSSMSKSRAKLILAEGRESDFSVFAINFLNLLWNTNRLR